MRGVGRIVFYGLWVFLMVCCQQENLANHPKVPVGYAGDDLMNNDSFRTYLSSKPYVERGKKKEEEISFSTSVVGALDFLSRKGKKVDKADEEQLKKESVVILEMGLMQQHKSIFESKRNSLNKDKTMEYLIGTITNDVSIEQDGLTFYPTGHQYENSFGAHNKIRIYFFFKDLKKEKEYRITYHDRLFGSGLINFSMNKNLNI